LAGNYHGMSRQGKKSQIRKGGTVSPSLWFGRERPIPQKGEHKPENKRKFPRLASPAPKRKRAKEKKKSFFGTGEKCKNSLGKGKGNNGGVGGLKRKGENKGKKN